MRGRLLFAFAAGSLSVLALPPLGLAPLLWLTFPVLLLLAEQAETRRGAFAVGWAFGFGWFLFGLYWVSASMFVDLARFGWMVPFSATGLPLGLALFTGAATWAASFAKPAGRLPHALALGLAWTIAEWLRGHLLTGFPWNLTGQVWTAWIPVLQSVSVIGIYGLSLLTVLAALTPLALFGRRPALAAGGALAFALLALAGWMRVPAGDAPVVPGVQLRLLQPNIAQSMKWADDQLRQNFQLHLALAREPAADGKPAPTVVVWPETAVPFLLADEPEVRKVMAWATPPGGLTLTGSLRRDGKTIFNSMLALNAAGEVVGAYDKAHLVPFGEYMPLARWINLRGIAEAGDGDFGFGTGARTVPLPGLPGASPLICYEVIFPGAVTDPADRPGWLLNITNDAWFGHTAGPHQHLAIARTRAVEEGLPLVRAANTGISAIVDPYGRITAMLPLGQGGTVDGPLPAALPATIYARWGDLPLAVGVILLTFTVLVLTLGRRKR